jgi:hypothetical protein
MSFATNFCSHSLSLFFVAGHGLLDSHTDSTHFLQPELVLHKLVMWLAG